MENKPDGFYTTFEDDKRDVSYSNKGFDKIIVNFVGIETTCLKCHLSFLLKSKLYKYVKVSYVKEASPPASTQPSMSIPIVMSKTIY